MVAPINSSWFSLVSSREKILFVGGIIAEIGLVALAVFAKMNFEILATTILVGGLIRLVITNRYGKTFLEKIQEKDRIIQDRDAQILALEVELKKWRTEVN